MAPRYLDALEAQVELIRKYSGPAMPTAVFRQLDERDSGQDVRDWTAAMIGSMKKELVTAPTFYVRTAALAESMKVKSADLRQACVEGHHLPTSMFVLFEQQTLLTFEKIDNTLIEAKAILMSTWNGTAAFFIFQTGEHGLFVKTVHVWQQVCRDGETNTNEAKAMFDMFLGLTYFMQQKLASGFHYPLERGTFRRAVRVSISNPDIVVITLRKTVRKDTVAAGIPNPVFWTHQWEVAGHDHMYWVGTGDDKRLEPRWVEAYRKGPVEAPFIKKDRVHDVKR